MNKNIIQWLKKPIKTKIDWAFLDSLTNPYKKHNYLVKIGVIKDTSKNGDYAQNNVAVFFRGTPNDKIRNNHKL